MRGPHHLTGITSAGRAVLEPSRWQSIEAQIQKET
jgi:hypothetical protein